MVILPGVRAMMVPSNPLFGAPILDLSKVEMVALQVIDNLFAVRLYKTVLKKTILLSLLVRGCHCRVAPVGKVFSSQSSERGQKIYAL